MTSEDDNKPDPESLKHMRENASWIGPADDLDEYLERIRDEVHVEQLSTVISRLTGG